MALEFPENPREIGSFLFTGYRWDKLDGEITYEPKKEFSESLRNSETRMKLATFLSEHMSETGYDCKEPSEYIPDVLRIELKVLKSSDKIVNPSIYVSSYDVYVESGELTATEEGTRKFKKILGDFENILEMYSFLF